MGKPIRIDDLARSMIRLMGKDVRDANSPDGDITIAYAGQRPGEKLYEELLITPDKTTPTMHPRIVTSLEPVPSILDVRRGMKDLRRAIESRDRDLLLSCVRLLVEGYTPVAGDVPMQAHRASA